MPRTLYLGNLPPHTQKHDLEERLDQVKQENENRAELRIGSIEIRLPLAPTEPRSRTYGFVDAATDAEAAALFELLDGTEFDGRLLTVVRLDDAPKK